MEKTLTASVGAPIDLEVLGTDAPQTKTGEAQCVAMLICHGMGQQVPFETLDAVATAIADEHIEEHGETDSSVNVVLRFVRPSGIDKLFPRAEVTLKVAGQANKTVHLYEAYWAPLTEGIISYSQTSFHLMKAGLKGLLESKKRTFKRWMFGGEKKLPIDSGTTRLVATAIAISTPFLILPFAGLSLKNIINGHGIISWPSFVVMLLLIATYFIRGFVVQYMGDVIIYVNSNEVTCFWKVRDEIKQIGLTLAKIVYGAIDTKDSHTKTIHEPDGDGTKKNTPSFLYSKIVVVGHSLGSVVAYDTLNAIINQDQLDGNMRRVVDRTDAFITFGSPLDKIVFLFRQKAKDAFTRDILAATHQPMILSYGNRPKWWINIFNRRDVISGALEYFDDPKSANSEQRRVRNFTDSYSGFNLVTAHTDYWKRSPTKTFLYNAAIGTIDEIERDVFPHKDKKIDIHTL